MSLFLCSSVYNHLPICKIIFFTDEGPGLGQNVWVIDKWHVFYKFGLVELPYWSLSKNLATQKLS